MLSFIIKGLNNRIIFDVVIALSLKGRHNIHTDKLNAYAVVIALSLKGRHNTPRGREVTPLVVIALSLKGRHNFLQTQ